MNNSRSFISPKSNATSSKYNTSDFLLRKNCFRLPSPEFILFCCRWSYWFYLPLSPPLIFPLVPFPSIYQAIHPSMYPCVILFWPCLIWAGHSLASVHCCLKYSFSLAKFILGAHVLFPDVSSEFISGRVLPSCYYWACFTAHSLRLGKNVLIQLVVRFS